MTNKQLLKEQIKIIKEFDINDYKIENDRIVIDNCLNLSHLKIVPDNFLNNTTINGYLDLSSLKSDSYKNFLTNSTIEGNLCLPSLANISYKNFLNNTTINGSLFLGSITTISYKNFLNNTTIKGSLYLKSLKYIHKDVYSKIKNKIVTNNYLVIFDDTSYNILHYNFVL